MKIALSLRPALVLCAAALAFLLGCVPPPARVVSITRAPDKGLHYRVFTAEDAAKKPPLRLLVWLHPSGDSMIGTMESLAPGFAQHGFALLVPTNKQFQNWVPDEANQLMNVTLPDVATVPGVDAKRPILLGFSAGAQMALELWNSAPEKFGGVAVVGAAPLLPEGDKLVETNPKPSPKLAGTPMLVLVGEEEPVTRRWRERSPAWKAAGVPITLQIALGQGHDTLFEGVGIDMIHEWLDTIKAQK